MPQSLMLNGKASAKGSGRLWMSAVANEQQFMFLRALTSDQPCATGELRHRDECLVCGYSR